MNNATIKWGQGCKASCAVNFVLNPGLKPSASVRLRSTMGTVAEIELEPDAVMKLAAAFFSDPRFRVDRRKVKPDASLEAQTEALFRQLMEG